jgi:hypothetical protein
MGSHMAGWYTFDGSAALLVIRTLSDKLFAGKILYPHPLSGGRWEPTGAISGFKSLAVLTRKLTR